MLLGKIGGVGPARAEHKSAVASSAYPGARLFRDRAEAGRRLAEHLLNYGYQPGVIVLALPRGGVPVGHDVARRLGAPLDVFVARKLRLPGVPALVIGAIAGAGSRILNRALIQARDIAPETVEAVLLGERAALERCEAAYRRGRPPVQVQGRTVIVIDDAVVTGETMRAAIAALRHGRPRRIVAAVPVMARAAEAEVSAAADELVVVEVPDRLDRAGDAYEHFPPVPDEAVACLADSFHPFPQSWFSGRSAALGQPAVA